MYSVDENPSLLVNCCATTYIVTDIKKYISFDSSFDVENHVVELADGSRHKDIAKARGDAVVSIVDDQGEFHDVVLHNALCILSYRQDIL